MKFTWQMNYSNGRWRTYLDGQIQSYKKQHTCIIIQRTVLENVCVGVVRPSQQNFSNVRTLRGLHQYFQRIKIT